LEFWPECSSPNVTLFQIFAGDWLSQEQIRPGSLLGPIKIDAREYFLNRLLKKSAHEAQYG
jgi:hypothetical protein